MIDHLVVFKDAASADAVFPPPSVAAPVWSQDGIDVMPVSVIFSYPKCDAEGQQTEPGSVAPGVWYAVRADGVIRWLHDMDECVVVTEHEAAIAREPYVVKCSLHPRSLLGQVSPAWAGDNYPVPVGSRAVEMDEWRMSPDDIAALLWIDRGRAVQPEPEPEPAPIPEPEPEQDPAMLSMMASMAARFATSPPDADVPPSQDRIPDNDQTESQGIL